MELAIKYVGKGWFKIKSLTKKNKHYYCYPKEAYCTCPSLKKLCVHLRHLYARQQDKMIGIEL